MKRKEFMMISGSALVVAASGLCAGEEKKKVSFPPYRGFNLLEKFGTPHMRYSGSEPRQKFLEWDFETMAEWGFDFARIPMSYWEWSSPEDWFTVNHEVLNDIDEVVELGRQHGIHISLNMHRIPGYCVTGRDFEPVDLFSDSEENMQKALDGALFQWKLFAERYKGIPGSQLSFDLINEPPSPKEEQRYEDVCRVLIRAIREIDPDRLIVSDGIEYGNKPVFGLAGLGIVQSTRGYLPLSVTHHEASWLRAELFETDGSPIWPLVDKTGRTWNKEVLKERLIDPWKKLEALGVPVHVGEWGVYNRTPHDTALAWMKDALSLWKEAGWGCALWNLRGSFGVFDSDRKDVVYENYKGHRLDRKMLEVLRFFDRRI